MPDIPDITVGYSPYPADTADQAPDRSSQAAPLPPEENVTLFNALMSGNADSSTDAGDAAANAADQELNAQAPPFASTARDTSTGWASLANMSASSDAASQDARSIAGIREFQGQAVWTASAQTQNAQASPFADAAGSHAAQSAFGAGRPDSPSAKEASGAGSDADPAASNTAAQSVREAAGNAEFHGQAAWTANAQSSAAASASTDTARSGTARADTANAVDQTQNAQASPFADAAGSHAAQSAFGAGRPDSPSAKAASGTGQPAASGAGSDADPATSNTAAQPAREAAGNAEFHGQAAWTANAQTQNAQSSATTSASTDTARSGTARADTANTADQTRNAKASPFADAAGSHAAQSAFGAGHPDSPSAKEAAGAGAAFDANAVNKSGIAAGTAAGDTAEAKAMRDAMPNENGIPERTLFNRSNALDEPITRHDLASGFAKADPRSRETAAGRLSESSDRLKAAFREDMRVQESSESGGPAASLHSLFSEMARRAEPMPAAGPAQAFADHAEPARADQALLESMVERILVSAPEQGSHEVRLTLNAQFLRGTDIVLNRDAGGALAVTLQAGDPSTFQTLVAAQGELKQLLETQEHAEVRVTVTGNAHEEQNDSRQRSRGYAGYEPDER